jgi:molybdopterin-guanine dinucleotide biosynthesis protein A
VAGIILSGGKSSRIGQEKGLIDFRGKPLISYAINVLKRLTDSIIIGANNELNRYKAFHCPVITDEKIGMGPIGGLYTTIKNSNYQKNYIISCDMPFINPELLRYLYQNMGDADIVVATQGAGKIEPLCGVYSRKILPEIENAIRNGHYKILDLFNKVQTETVLINDDLPFYSDQLFYNINRPEDILI